MDSYEVLRTTADGIYLLIIRLACVDAKPAPGAQAATTEKAKAVSKREAAGAPAPTLGDAVAQDQAQCTFKANGTLSVRVDCTCSLLDVVL